MSLKSGHYETHVYGADSALLKPWKLLGDMWRDAVGSRQLALILAVRDLRAQYRQSLLGLFWMIAPPIVVAVGLSVAQQNDLINFGESKIPTIAFTLIGMSIWQVFAAAVSGPLQVIGSYRSVVTKVVVPPEAIILSSLVKLGIMMVIQLLLITFAFLWFGLPFKATTLLGLPALVGVAMFGTAIGLFLTPVGLLYRDIALAIPIIEKGWLVVTPAVFAAKALPPGGFYALASRINPMTYLVTTTRQLVSGEHLTVLPQFFGSLGLALVLLFFGLILVRAAMPLVIERWSS
ncbi:MAG TPA: ABC transporter permease [Chthoniobacterales bacterium]|jgi:lipopolysaccharide transport system permease protein